MKPMRVLCCLLHAPPPECKSGLVRGRRRCAYYYASAAPPAGAAGITAPASAARHHSQVRKYHPSDAKSSCNPRLSSPIDSQIATHRHSEMRLFFLIPSKVHAVQQQVLRSFVLSWLWPWPGVITFSQVLKICMSFVEWRTFSCDPILRLRLCFVQRLRLPFLSPSPSFVGRETGAGASGRTLIA